MGQLEEQLRKEIRGELLREMRQRKAKDSGEDRPMRLDEIMSRLSALAREPGADRVRALKILSGLQAPAGSAVVLPPPLTVEERLRSMAHLMRAMGREEVDDAYRRAFPLAEATQAAP